MSTDKPSHFKQLSPSTNPGRQGKQGDLVEHECWQQVCQGPVSGYMAAAAEAEAFDRVCRAEAVYKALQVILCWSQVQLPLRCVICHQLGGCEPAAVQCGLERANVDGFPLLQYLARQRQALWWQS